MDEQTRRLARLVADGDPSAKRALLRVLSRECGVVSGLILNKQHAQMAAIRYAVERFGGHYFRTIRSGVIHVPAPGRWESTEVGVFCSRWDAAAETGSYDRLPYDERLDLNKVCRRCLRGLGVWYGRNVLAKREKDA